MSSLPYYDQHSQYHADSAQADSDPLPVARLWDGVNTQHTQNNKNSFTDKEKSPSAEDAENIPSSSTAPESDQPSGSKKPDSARKGFRSESRPRRTYACGPCKRYKMKCNLEKPCQSCVTSKRINDCLENPANPPSEEEKSKIERRRRRNSRKKNLDKARVRTSKPWPEKASETSPPALHGSPKVESISSAASESSPSTIKTLSPSGKDYVFNLNVPLATDFVAPPPCRVRRIQNYKFMKEYAIACQQQTSELPQSTVLEIASLLDNVSYDACVQYFQKYADTDCDGVQYLVDIKDYFNVAHNLIVKVSQMVSGGNSVLDGFSMRGLSLTVLVFAYKEICEGHFPRAQRWVKVSQDVIAALGDPDTLEDLIHHGIWLVMMKPPLLLGGEQTKMMKLYENYVLKIANSSEFMQYICFKKQAGAGRPIPGSELDTLTQDLSERFKKRGTHDHFVAAARLWILIKLSEVQINVMSASGTLQLRYMGSHATIQPNNCLLGIAFDEKLGKLQEDWSFFSLVLSISGRFFGRFDSFTNQTDLIYSYLTLYNDLHAMTEPIEIRLHTVLSLMEPIAFIEKFSETICVLVMKYYLNVRWLTITKVEKPHFPSLRFAHYVSNIMVMHRVMQVLDSRLSGSGDLDIDPAYLDDNSQVNVYLVLYHTCKNFVILELVYSMTYQALFLAVLSQFVSDPRYSAHVDLSYVFGHVHDSLRFARAKIESISFIRGMPAVGHVLSFVGFFHDFALGPAFLTSYAPDFLNRISALMAPAAWNTMTSLCFGSSAQTGDYIGRMWEFFAYFGTTSAPVKVSNHLILDTAFFRSFETAVEPFNFSVQLVEDYIRDVVMAAPDGKRCADPQVT